MVEVVGMELLAGMELPALQMGLFYYSFFFKYWSCLVGKSFYTLIPYRWHHC